MGNSTGEDFELNVAMADIFCLFLRCIFQFIYFLKAIS